VTDKVLLTEQYGPKSYYKASEFLILIAFSDVHFSHYCVRTCTKTDLYGNI